MAPARHGIAALVVASLLLLARSASAQEKAPGSKDGPPRTSEAVYEQLEKPYYLLFNLIPLPEVVAEIGAKTGVVVVVDDAVAKGAAGTKLWLRVRGCALRKTLEILLVAVPGDPTFEVWRGAVLLTSASHPRKLPPVPDLAPEAKKAFEEKRIDPDWSERPLAEVVAELSRASGVALSLGDGVDGKITLRGKGIPVGSAVDFVCRLNGLKVVTNEGKVQLVKTAEGDAPGPAEPVPASFTANDSQAGAEAGTGAVAHKLLHTTLTASFKGSELGSVLKTIQQKGDMNVVADPNVDLKAKVTLELADATLKAALTQTLEPLGCMFEIGGGLVRVHRKK
jgi:hypothetical protein